MISSIQQITVHRFRFVFVFLLISGTVDVALSATADGSKIDPSASVAEYAWEQYAVRTYTGTTIVYPKPDGIATSSDYRLYVNDREVFCYADRRFDFSASKDEFGMTTSPQTYAIFDFAGTVDVRIEILNRNLLAATEQFRVTPQIKGVEATLKGNVLTFRLDRPGDYVVDPDGTGLHALQLFTNEPETKIPDRSDPNVIFFGPGVHNIDSIVLQSGQTLYVSGGAVLQPLPTEPRPGWDGRFEEHYSGFMYTQVMPAIRANNASNIVICGHGVISAGRGLPAGKRFGVITLRNCRNVLVQGVTLTEASSWTFYQWYCTDCVADRIRVLSWFTNGDGPCIGSCGHVTVKNSFVHTADDGMEIKTDKQHTAHDILFSNCISWCDVGTAMGFTYEIFSAVSNVTFRDITVLHFNYQPRAVSEIPQRGTLTILPVSGGDISDVSFEHITIESHETTLPVIFLYNGKDSLDDGTPYAKMARILFEDIRVLSGRDGYDQVTVYDHSPSGGLFKDIELRKVLCRQNDGKPFRRLKLETQGDPDVTYVNPGSRRVDL